MQRTLEVLKRSETRVSPRVILSLIRRQGPIDRSELAQRLDTSYPTVTRSISELLSLGLIERATTGESTGGRKPLLYDIAPGACTAIGAVIGEREIEVAAVDLRGEIVEMYTTKREAGDSPENAVNTICSAVDHMTTKHRSLQETMLGMCVATSGPLDRRSGLVRNSWIFPSKLWGYVPLVEMLRERFGSLLLLENRARVGALAETWYGAVNGSRNLVFVHLSYGIGAGIVEEGRLVERDMDITGALGNMVIDYQTALRGENRGTVLEHASLTGLLERWAAKPGSGSDAPSSERPPTAEEFFQAVSSGNSAALETLEEGAAAFAVALANFFNVLWPDLIVLGGEIADRTELFLDKVNEIATNFVYPGNRGRIVLRRSSLGSASIVKGAAAKIFEYFLEGGDLKKPSSVSVFRQP